MWQQVYDPLGSPYLSALVAAIPIIIFLLGLTVLKWSGLNAAIVSLITTVVLAVFVFHMPLAASLSASGYGVLNGLWPIGWIVLMAVWLYRITVRAGNFTVIKGSISAISADQRLQVLLIAFCFGGFLEGAAGFGIPIAICAALLVTLGFNPIKASLYSLIANVASGAYGAIGIPVIVGAKQGGLDPSALNAEMVPVLQIISVFIPLLIVLVQDGLRGVRQVGWVALVIGIVVSGLQALILTTVGPELVDIVPPLVGLVILALICMKWQPSYIYREENAPALEHESNTSFKASEILKAWSPFLILSGFILLWSVPAVKALWGEKGLLAWSNIKIQMPALHQKIEQVAPIVQTPKPMTAVYTWSIIGASGTAILLAVLLTVVVSNISWKEAGEEFKGAILQLWKPVVMICLVMAVANVMNFGGMSSSIALAVAKTGFIFPFLSPVIGWIGVFVTGSVVNNNTLFAALQATTAQQIGASPNLLVAANTAGGVVAKMVSPQSIAIAAASVNMAGEEAKITNAAIKYSLALLAIMCIWVFALSFIF